MAAPVSAYFQSKVAPRNSLSGRPSNTNTDVWASDKNYQNSTDLQETTSSKEAVMMGSVHHNNVRHTPVSGDRFGNSNKRLSTIYPANATHVHSEEPSAPILPKENLVRQRTIENVQHIAIVGIISSILIAIIVVGILTLIFSLQQDVPTGTILLYSGISSALREQNDRWLFCNGSQVSRATYHGLFAVIGTTYGVGNGIDTFNLPDFRARFPLGSLTSTDTSLIAGGYSSHTITIAELPAHDHDQGSLQTLSNGLHTHSITDPGHNHGGSTGTGPFGSGTYAKVSSFTYGDGDGTHTHSIPVGATGITIQSHGSHTHTISGSTGTEGQGQPIDMMPPYQTVHYIIRT